MMRPGSSVNAPAVRSAKKNMLSMIFLCRLTAPLRAAAKAIGTEMMTDTDNSATACVSYFGDIFFSAEQPERG